MPTYTLLLIGGSGFIGCQLGAFLHARGHTLRVLSRRTQLLLPFPAQHYRWQQDGTIPVAALAGVDAVVNLAGVSIAAGRWTVAQRQQIVASRLQPTRALAVALRSLDHQPVVVQASGSGYYGDCGAEYLAEDAAAGTDFLALTAQQWEQSLTAAGLENRCLILRFGMVLGNDGGALTMLHNIYRWGGGASLGSGQQYVSWVHSDDVCEFVLHVLHDPACRGVYNLVAPQAVTYDMLHRALLQHFRPWFASPWRVPAWLLRLVLGEKAALVLASQRAVPQRALASGYVFRFDEIGAALAALAAPSR